MTRGIHRSTPLGAVSRLAEHGQLGDARLSEICRARFEDRLCCRLAGIEPWELFRVDNSCCTGMPLGVPERDAASNPAGQSLVHMQSA